MLNTTIAGGQTWLHKMRMLRQVLWKSSLFAFVVGSCFLSYKIFTIHVDAYKSVWYWTKASLAHQIGIKRIGVSPNFWKKIAKSNLSRNHLHKTQNVITLTSPVVSKFKIYLIKQLKIIALLFIGSKSLAIAFFSYLGKDTSKKKTISGGKIISPRKKARELKRSRQASPIKIGSVPMIKGTETRHTIITGGTGAGKTNCLHTLLPQIRNQPAIIVDTTGEFVEKYYREGRDTLLNPYDKRSVTWHPWAECKENYDGEAIGQSLIPQSNHESEAFWRQAATTLFVSVLKKTTSEKTSELVNHLLFEKLSALCNFLEGTRAASVVDMGSEKTAASVRSVCATFVSCLETLEDTKNPFSIRQWVEEEKNSWLFLHCTPQQRAQIRPLLSCWFSIATNALMRKTISFDRRIWFVVDELRSLQKLPELETFVVEARKYGGCGIFSIQSPSQLFEIYGRAATETILGNCQTKIIFNENEPKTAKLISEFFGETEIEELQKSISFGSNEVRDGVSLSSQKRIRPLVSASAIQSLKTNEAFLRLPGSQTVSKIQFTIQK